MTPDYLAGVVVGFLLALVLHPALDGLLIRVVGSFRDRGA